MWDALICRLKALCLKVVTGKSYSSTNLQAAANSLAWENIRKKKKMFFCVWCNWRPVVVRLFLACCNLSCCVFEASELSVFVFVKDSFESGCVPPQTAAAAAAGVWFSSPIRAVCPSLFEENWSLRFSLCVLVCVWARSLVVCRGWYDIYCGKKWITPQLLALKCSQVIFHTLEAVSRHVALSYHITIPYKLVCVVANSELCI